MWLLSCLLLSLFSSAHAAKLTAGKPERLVASGGECVRLFNSQGAVGCRSLSTNDMAALFPVESESELAAWLSDTSDVAKRVLVIPEHLLTTDLLTMAKSRLAGIFAYPASGHNVSFALTSPQGDGSPDASLNPFASQKVAWNPDGLGVVGQQVAHPIVLLQDEALGKTFLARAKQNRRPESGATYRAVMNFYYGPEDMDSRRCLRFTDIYGESAPRCDPIGGQSAWGVRGDRSANETIVVMAAMDANGLAHALVPGANEAASGVVALLAAAKALQAIPDTEFSKQIVFALFQGEKFGFVGSRRFLQDLTKAEKHGERLCSSRVKRSNSPFGSEFCSSPVYPSLEFATVKPSTFTYAIAVDQVGRLTKSGNFSIHVNPKGETTALVKTIVSAPSAKAKFSRGSVAALPPSPLLSFVNENEFGRKDLASAVIAGYDSAFVGAYGSRHDVVGSVDVDAVVQAAQVLAETVYSLGAKSVSSSSMTKIQVGKALVEAMLSCLSEDWECDLMVKYSTPWVKTMIKYLKLVENSWPAGHQPPTMYCGVLEIDRQPLVITEANKKSYTSVTSFNGSWSDDANLVKLFPTAYEVFSRAFLAASLADIDAMTEKPCQKSQDCDGVDMECVYPGKCASRRAHFHDAYSPGLTRTPVIKVYDIVDESMPLWAEPRWDLGVGGYVFPDPGELIGWLALALGVVVTGVGMVVSRRILASLEKNKVL